MARRKRGPPLSYDEKYRQIKESGFDVDISKPITPSSKAMVTRYHRILFGGITSSGAHTRGIARQYKPTESKYADDIRKLFGVKGAARIKDAYFPKYLGSVTRVTKNFISFRTKAGTFKILNANPKTLAMATPEERERMLRPIRGKSAQIMIGNSIQGLVFENIDDLDTALEAAINQYSRGQVPIRVIL